MRHLIPVFAVCLVAAPLAQQRASTLDDPIPGTFQMATLSAAHPCAGFMALDLLARVAHVPVGLEKTTDCALDGRTRTPGPESETVSGVSAREAVDHLVASMPRYSWKEVSGVVVIRPTSAWTDPHDLLNQHVQPFDASDVSPDDVLHATLRAATPSLFMPHQDVPRSGALVNLRMTIAFPGGTLLDALNAIVDASGSAAWQVGYVGGEAWLSVSTFDFPGDHVMAPAGLPQPHW